MQDVFWSHFNKVLKIGQVIVIMFITNLLFFLFSGVSLLFLMPVCIASAFHISKLILDKKYDGLMLTYLRFIKEHALKCFKVSFPLLLLIIIIGFNLYWFNEGFIPIANPYVFTIILLLQVFIGFEALNIMLLSLIQLTINADKSFKLIMRDAFLVGNRYFFRMIMSSMVFIVVYMLGTNFSPLFFMISTTLMLFLYYGSFSFIIKKHFDQTGRLVSK
ncbi:hypothetical protein [Haloplasma contractile]|uniref:DUF624 domain-containing protein n=1 Tax=Haloplasma contractile SSD-17B TaxID=1033810 RepID=F7PWG8_9MOLU|nr:hypothetical protein [Haloplasma contractile]ERJ11888.1 hypothetical protein HLPCO_002128 [Haloplasma contractile SSD-17B]